ncbi:unnamed protein product, partial [Closterium sp. NIES-53]
LPPVSPLPAPSPYAGPTGGLAERRAPASRPALPARPARTSRPCPPPVPGTHQMTLRPSTAPLRVPLPSPPATSLPVLADPESDSLRAASPTVARFLATVVTGPSLASTAASALVAELVDFAACCRLDYAASLVAESVRVCPPSIGGECALSTDVLEDRQEEFQCFAAALPHLVSTLLAPEGDPDAPDIPTPRSYAEAIEGPYSSQWQAAMDAEMASWKSTGTYVDEVPPPGANIVIGMLIFRVKRSPVSLPVFKALYISRGFTQRQGVDFFQTFSPTPKMTTLRGSLHEEIWLRRPPGFTGSFPAGTQWSLRRPVYGLRQAPREWHDTLRTTLVALGFAPSTADPSLFLRTNTNLPPFYVLVYVDDLVFATADTEALAHVKSELQKRHTCTDLGELTSYLGLRITQDRAQRTITLTQSHMVQQVLQRFGFTYSLPQSTPLPTGHSLSDPPSDESVEPSGPYPELVGCLMYLMTCTRPDLAYPLSLLARYMALGRHRKMHWDAAKRVLRYLCSTSGMGLVLGGRARVVLTGHADASWVDDLATQRSSQGYTFSLGSGSVSWRSTRSSSELRWLTYLLTDLGEEPRSPPVLYVDNKAMLALCQEHRPKQRTKHIALRYFLARDLQQRGQLRLAYVASQANTADVFTKALQPSCFAFLNWSCGLFFSPNLPMGQPPLVQPPLGPEQPPLAPEAVTPGAAAPGLRAAAPGPCSSRPWSSRPWTPSSRPWTQSSRPWPLQQPPLAPEAAAPGAAAPGPRAAAPGAAAPGLHAAAPGPCSSRPWSSRPWTSSSRPWPLKQPPLVQPPLDPEQPPLAPEAAAPGAAAPGLRAAVPGSRAAARRAPALLARRAPALPATDIFALDYDAILTAMYALPTSADRTCHLCATRDPGIEPTALGAGEAAALGASASPALGAGEAAAPGAGESALFGTAPAEALYTFTLDSGASRSFFRDSSTLTPLSRPIPVSLANPSGGPVLARSSTVLPCPAVLSGSLSGLHLPSFSMNLVSGADLQDHLYTLTTVSPQVAASATASGQLAAPCSCRSLSHQTLLWHHRLGHPSVQRLRSMHRRVLTLLWHHHLGHPSVQRLRSMHRRVLVSGLPRVLPPLPPSPAPPCLPCVEGWQRAAPHSSSFPPTEAPLQTLYLDVWGPAHVRGQGHERYFLLVVDDYTRYTTVFPLRTKGEVPDVLIPWIRAARLQLRERFGTDFPVLRLHSDRGWEFSSDLLAAFCAEHGIRQTFTLLASPQQNGVAERRIGLVMELNLWPRASLPETSPTLLWTGKVGDASRFRVWGACAFVRDTTADKLSAHTVPNVFLGFVPDAPGWQFYHPTSLRVFPSQVVTFDESVPFYRLFPYRTAPLPPLPLFLSPGGPQVDPLPAPGPAPSGVSQVDSPPLTAPVEVIGDSGPAAGGPARGAASGGAEPGGAEPGGAEPGDAEPGREESRGAEPGGTEPEGTAPGGAEASARSLAAGGVGAGDSATGVVPAGGSGAAEGAGARGCRAAEGAAAGGSGAAAGAGTEGSESAVARSPWSSRLRPRVPLTSQQLHDWYGRRQGRASGARGSAAGGTSADTTGAGSGAGPGGARTRGTGAAGAGGAELGGAAAGGAGPGGAGAEGSGAAGGTGTARGPGAAGAGSTAQPRLFFAPPSPSSQPPSDSVLRQVLSLPSSTDLPLQPGSPLPAPSTYTEQTGGLTKRREPASRPVSPVRSGRSGRRVPRSCQPAVPSTHLVVRCPSSPPQSVPLLSPPASSKPTFPEPESDRARAAHPTVTRLLATVVTDPSFESTAASALVAELVDFAAACRLDYAVSLVAEVKRPPRSPPVFKARYIARGFSQREGVEFFHTFSPTPKMTTLRVLLHVAAQRDYELHSLDFSTSFLQGSLHEEIWLRRPPGFTGSFPPGTQWSLRRPVYGLRQAPRQWHDTLRTTLAALGFAPSTADPSLFFTDTSLPPFYILVYVDDLVFATADTKALVLVKLELQKRHTCTDLGELRSYLGLQITRDRARRTITLTQSHMVQQVLQRFGFTWSSAQATPLATGHSLSAPPSNESVEPSGPYPELVGCLMYLMTCTRPDLAYPLGLLAPYVAPGRHRKVHMDATKRVLHYLCRTSGMGLVLGGRGDVFLTGHSDASWVDDQATQRTSQGYTFSLGSGSELRWLTYLLTDLGERPRSPPVLYIDNKAAIALCQEHRPEHRTKHIALRYFLARELQQRGQLRLAHVATRANTAYIFNKALPPGDHKPCFALAVWPCDPLFSPTLPMGVC